MSELSRQSHRNSKLELIDSIIKDFGCMTHENTESSVSYSDKLKHAVSNMRMTQVDGIPSIIDMTDYLYVGSIGCAYNFIELKRAGITHILCLSADIQLKYPDDFVYKRVDVIDKPNFDITASFSSCYEFIRDAESRGGRCLIHCYQGKSSFGSALERVRKNRSVASPNSGFLCALKRLERERNIMQSSTCRTTP